MSIDLTGTAVAAAWAGFAAGPWQEQIDVRDFVLRNVAPSSCRDVPLAGPSTRVAALVQRTSGEVGDWVAELIVGLPAQVWRTLGSHSALSQEFDDIAPQVVRAARAAHLVDGPADGGGRVLGDVRRVALYGVGTLAAAKRAERNDLDLVASTEQVVRQRADLAEQLIGLTRLAELGDLAGVDLTQPARTAREAAQWMLLAYLAGMVEHQTAETAWGRNAAFLDVYIQRDLVSGTLTPASAQEICDDLVLVLGMVGRLRACRPVVLTLGGTAEDGRHLVTDTSMRFLQAFRNVADGPLPALAVLWSARLPEPFRRGCARASLDGVRVTYVSDDLVRASWGDDAAIVGNASTAVRVGRQVTYGGVRVNLAKALLYAINGGRDELTGRQVGPVASAVTGDLLEFDDVVPRLRATLDWLAGVAVDALVCAHATRDRYGYERVAMGLSDAIVLRSLVCEVAGVAIAADGLAAIRHARVRPVRSTDGLVVDVEVEGVVPRFGTDDDRADDLAVWLLRTFMTALRGRQTYRGAIHAQGLVRPAAQDGTATGATPDGRPAQAPLFAWTGTPDELVASVAKMPYPEAQAGLACPYPVHAADLGETTAARGERLVGLVDAAICRGGAYGLLVIVR
ncbi:pyruvate formate lyase family protein [Cellulomonas citrea]|uniref:pyruvate formate lyase family protein n=1 Tax=Cellulomonas citrea TaxID=1909423 RepID=UPI0013568EE5|nr:pyruvate formate lyase family protein [Cellulomonas citrea]